MQRFLETTLDQLLQQGDAAVVRSNDAPSTSAASANPVGSTITPQLEASALDRALAAAANVPAYGEFLQQEGPECGPKAWDQVPFTTKANYYHKHPLAQRCYGGTLASADFVHQSSGSSGQPTNWARCVEDEAEVAVRFEQIFRDNFCSHERSTLAVVCLPLGSWVGGMFTAFCTRYLSLKRYKLTLVTPGNKVSDILHFCSTLGPCCQQTVLLGYPPAVKGTVDAGIAAGVDWSALNLKLVLAGEVFSEEWRALMVARCGMRDALRDVVSIYGTADAGVIGQETALSTAIRGWLASHPQHARELFGKDRLPTLLQYDPGCRLLETHPGDGTIVVTALQQQTRRGAPLLRYCIGDEGGLMDYSEMLQRLEGWGFDALASVGSSGGGAVRTQPFVWVFGRSFWAVSVYGANVYVENVMAGLDQPSMQAHTTGKFVLHVATDGDHNTRLGVKVELAQGTEAGEKLQQAVAEAILEQLLRLNSEYGAYVAAEVQLPLVELYPCGDAQWFPVGVKHKYTLQ